MFRKATKITDERMDRKVKRDEERKDSLVWEEDRQYTRLWNRYR